MTSQAPTVTPAKKPYQTPKLTTYGEVRVLTQASTSGSSEGSSGSGIMMPSDSRLKENIVPVGRHPMGLNLYLFDYKAPFQARYGAGRRFGVIADEVEKVLPAAVKLNEHGHKTVDLAMLGLRISH